MISEGVVLSSSSLAEQRFQHIDVYVAVKCSGNNQAKQFCVNQACTKKRVFTCFTQQCKCQSDHQKCHKCDVSYVAKKIRHKLLYPAASIKDQINKKFDDIIDKLSDCRNNMLLKIAELQLQINLTQLSEAQCKFLEVVEDDDNLADFTGKQASSVWQSIGGKNQQTVQLFKDLKVELQKFKKQSFQMIEAFQKRTDKMNESFENSQRQLLLVKKRSMPKRKAFPQQILVSRSAIIQKQQQAKLLLSFFPKQVKQITLLFRASEHGFNLSQYFKLCGDQTNTMILCVTNKDKIIGGFTPLSHNYTGKGYQKEQGGQYEHDPSSYSFIFSLTNGDKFDIKKQYRAIYRYIDEKYICFGAQDLRICNESDKNMDCCTMTNKNYTNFKYRKNDQKSYEMMNGNESELFSTKQWQVWKLQMKSY